MNEENLKVYSFRLGESESKRLDKLAKEHPYWGRSAIVRALLLAVFNTLTDNQIFDLVRFGQGYRKINVKITINFQ